MTAPVESAKKSSSARVLTVSGSAAVAFIAFMAGIAGLATWATSDANAHRVIGEQAGKFVAIGMAIVFLIAAVGPTLIRRFPIMGKKLDGVGEALEPVGVVASAIDALLVSSVAPLAGVTLSTTLRRYSVLLVHLGCAALFAYWLQENEGRAWPLLEGAFVAHWASFVPLVWGFLVAFAVSRRWAWIESDREQAMLTGEFEKSDKSGIRIGFDQDLRDEALLSFMFMFLFAPLAFSQLAKYGLFHYEAGWSPDYTDWLGFFGAELAKAVPFVDWAETYNVGSGTRIEPNLGAGQHVVFVARVLIDLIVLAALLQAMSISSRISRQKAEFEAGRLPRLDPFLEKAEFARLVAGGDAFAADDLGHFKYDLSRLQTLTRDQSYSPEVRAVALRLLNRQQGNELVVGGLLRERLAGAHGYGPDKSRRVRALCAKLLASRNDDESVAALKSGLEADVYSQSGRHEARKSLVRHIGSMRDAPSAYGVLEWCAKTDAHREVRVQAMEAMVGLKGAGACGFLVERGMNAAITGDEAKAILRLLEGVASESLQSAMTSIGELLEVQRHSLGAKAKQLAERLAPTKQAST